MDKRSSEPTEDGYKVPGLVLKKPDIWCRRVLVSGDRDRTKQDVKKTRLRLCPGR